MQHMRTEKLYVDFKAKHLSRIPSLQIFTLETEYPYKYLGSFIFFCFISKP